MLAVVLQDNTIADRPMMELMMAVQHMLDDARQSAAHTSRQSGRALHQLVLIVADGRFHERDALRRVVAVSCLIAAIEPVSGNTPFT